MYAAEPTILFHGPTAQGRAAEEAVNWGRVVGSFGHPKDGMDIACVREAVSAMTTTPVGDRRGAVVVGPVDILTQEGIVDALLKTVEEKPKDSPRAFLWAWDLGSVRPTIRSRCHHAWCPGRVSYEKKTLDAATQAVESSLQGSTAGVIETFLGMRDQWGDEQDEFLRAAVYVLATKTDPKRFLLWSRIRPLFREGRVTCEAAMMRFVL